jgi:hypothetical protein
VALTGTEKPISDRRGNKCGAVKMIDVEHQKVVANFEILALTKHTPIVATAHVQ